MVQGFGKDQVMSGGFELQRACKESLNPKFGIYRVSGFRVSAFTV